MNVDSGELFTVEASEPRAVFSPCRTYRYELWRRWNAGKAVVFIGLNPSTADEEEDDPTIRRCIGFAKLWGYGALCMANLFAYRATDPEEMKRVEDPVGPENDDTLQRLSREHDTVIAAWGVHGAHRGRDKDVLSDLRNLRCLGLTQEGHPKHPLYLPKTFSPMEWTDSMRADGETADGH